MLCKTFCDGLSYNDEVFNCRDVSCKSEVHRESIDIAYNAFVTGLMEISANIATGISKQQNSCKSFKGIPGWNTNVREAHDAAREAFGIWHHNGKPRNGLFFDVMKRTRAIFKYSLRHCKRSETQQRADALAKSLYQKDYDDFWKDIKGQQNVNKANPSCIAGEIGSENIVNMWEKHYRSLFCLNAYDHKHMDSIYSDISGNIGNCTWETLLCTYNDVYKAVNQLKTGKSSGLDGLSSEHILLSCPFVCKPLAALFTSMLTHGFMPQSMINSVIVPVVKSKTKSVMDKSNYRPIALATVLSKVFERILLKRLEKYVSLEDNQFGFRQKLSTDLCIFVLKECLRFYTTHGSNMYVCFLDATAAFDRISHAKLFEKLINLKVPLYIVRILFYWYINQKICIRWNNIMSSCFYVTNGVRQGGILSPLLFNIYMNDLSLLLNTKTIGCTLSGSLYNHFMYADDIVIFAPSAKGLQHLIDLCHTFGNDHHIIFNSQKTVCMVCGKSSNRGGNTCSFQLGNDNLSQVLQFRYLGHIICSDLTDNADMNRQIRALYTRANMLLRKFGNCSDNVKSYLFKSYCTNLYCSHLWSVYNCGTYNKLKVAYNNSFRILLKLPKRCSASEMFVTRHVVTFEALLRINYNSLVRRTKDSVNIYIKQIFSSDLVYNSSLLSVIVKKLHVR